MSDHTDLGLLERRISAVEDDMHKMKRQLDRIETMVKQIAVKQAEAERRAAAEKLIKLD